MTLPETSLDQVFVEQAEYLEDDVFEKWNASHPDESSILRKLTQGGAKLISGPRGSGKTTLLKKAFHVLISEKESALPVYVNYKRSLSIEPLYKEGQNGSYWFHQWIIFKVYLGAYETLERIGSNIELSISRAEARRSAEFLEMSNSSKIDSEPVSIGQLEEDLIRVLDKTGRTRCILLLDDAAHAFSADQQRDFFDFFRQVKSQFVSPKAAIYPGVTNYSSSFHVGHDAEQIDIWIKPDRDEYLSFMRKIIFARFPENIEDVLTKNTLLVDFLCFASFGVPRALLNMIQSLIAERNGGDLEIDLSRVSVVKAVKQHYASTVKLFTSLTAKLPVYKRFIETGESILENALALIKKYNKEKPTEKQSVSIAIPNDEFSHELARVFSLFQYAGLCIPKEELVSRGEKGRFRLFTLHYGGIIDANAMIGGRAISIQAYVTAFSERDAHEFTRTRPPSLLSGVIVGDAFTLSLPPCAVCQTPRLYEEAQFCAKCGSPLTIASTYFNLINSNIDNLPLTASRIEKIKKQSSIRKIKDILMDHEHGQLLKVDRIGIVWAAKIVRLAEEFVE